MIFTSNDINSLIDSSENFEKYTRICSYIRDFNESNVIKKFVGRERVLFQSTIKELLPKSPVCLEIGVREGSNASSILSVIKPSTLYLLDICFAKTFPCSDILHESLDNQTCKKITTKSTDTSWVPEGMLFDFIYIDARHNYNHVINDIETWFPYVSRGGIIGGHDYVEHTRGVWGVDKAVQEFYNKNKNLLIELPFRYTLHHNDVDSKNGEHAGLCNPFKSEHKALVCWNEWALIKK